MSTDPEENTLLLATRNYQFRQECMNGIIRNWFPVFVKYPVNPVPRFGYGRPANQAIHDIHLPNDYPPERAKHYESEQYLLAALLLAAGNSISNHPSQYFYRKRQQVMLHT